MSTAEMNAGHDIYKKPDESRSNLQFMHAIPLLLGGLSRDGFFRGTFEQLVELFIAGLHVGGLLPRLLGLYDQALGSFCEVAG